MRQRHKKVAPRLAGIFAGVASVLLQTGFFQQQANAQEPTQDTVRSAHDTKAPQGQRCTSHGISKEKCFICDAALREKGRLWCKEHDRYEDRCFICHPEIKDPDRLWCKEHSLYEDECPICQPTSSATNDATCEAHRAPAEQCFMCDPALREKGRLWCKEHDRYEDRCFICHPDLEDEGRVWCEEHALYEDECPICRPSSLEPSDDAGEGTRDPARLWCAEHDVYEDECFLCHPELKEQTGESRTKPLMCEEHGVLERECGICHPELAAQLTPGTGLKIRLASENAASKAAVRTAVTREDTISDGIEVYAELMFNQNKLAHVALPVDGIIRSVDVDLGHQVKRGTVLATVTSVEISQAIGNYLRALAQDRLHEQAVERARTLRQEEISSERELQEAIAAHQAADAEVLQTEQQLTTLGLSPSQIADLAKENPKTSVLEIRAPFDGEIVARTAVQGALAETGTALFKVADRSTMWATLNIPEKEVGHVQIGQQVELTVDSAPDQVFLGTLTWIAAEVDELTRMAKARAEIPNPKRSLRSGTFARGRIITKPAGQAVVVPQSSVQQVDDRPFVFVKLDDDLYEARHVKLGAKQDGRHEVASGLAAGESIVVGNSFVMKSQLLLSRLGAGCVDD